jgi:hypothetical protein
LIRHLEAENHYFLINVDAKCGCPEEFYVLQSEFRNIHFTKQFNVMHGGFSQIACTMEQIEEMYALIPDFDYVHTISGQDYPCVGNTAFDTFFESTDQSYMNLDSEEELVQWKKENKYSHRLEHWYFMDLFNSRFLCKIHFAGVLWRLLYWIPRPYKGLDQVCGGWNWFSVSHSVMDYICAYLERNPDYVKRFRYTISGDELIFNNLLNSVTKQLKINRRNSLRYVDWYPIRETDSLPLILNEEDYPAIAESGCFFCRKVDENASKKLMDLLDEKINLNI